MAGKSTQTACVFVVSPERRTVKSWCEKASLGRKIAADCGTNSGAEEEATEPEEEEEEENIYARGKEKAGT